MGLSRANNTATVSGADVVRRLRDRSLGSKRRHSVPAPAGRRLRSLARQEDFSPAPPTIIRNLINYKSYEEITTNLLHAVIVKSFQVGYDAAGLGRLVRTMSIHLVKK